MVTFVSYTPPEVMGYKYTRAEEGLGWAISMLSPLPIVVVAGWKFGLAEGGVKEVRRDY